MPKLKKEKESVAGTNANIVAPVLDKSEEKIETPTPTRPNKPIRMAKLIGVAGNFEMFITEMPDTIIAIKNGRKTDPKNIKVAINQGRTILEGYSYECKNNMIVITETTNNPFPKHTKVELEY